MYLGNWFSYAETKVGMDSHGLKGEKRSRKQDRPTQHLVRKAHSQAMPRILSSVLLPPGALILCYCAPLGTWQVIRSFWGNGLGKGSEGSGAEQWGFQKASCSGSVGALCYSEQPTQASLWHSHQGVASVRCMWYMCVLTQPTDICSCIFSDCHRCRN